MQQSTLESEELLRVLNKSIFDSFNEALNHFRPYFELEGLPYPWQRV